VTTDATRKRESAGHGDKSRLHEKAIAALLTAPTLEDAAKTTGVSRATLLRWTQEPVFKAALRDARRQVIDATIAHLQGVTGEAVAALRKALTCNVPTVRVSAARALLEYGFRSWEMVDLEERLAAVEQRFADQGGGQV
jgi:hypothetical protein